MPKRLCAVALTKSQTTIIVGDKFGDVYALPLHPSMVTVAATSSKPDLDKKRLLQPSASELTVHTRGNRHALKQQQAQRNSGPTKQAPTFEHHLILGHVSVLTDLAIGSDKSKNDREYILTADRDEHIRVSRGVPQAHIINNYCFGHTTFVSRLCIPADHPQYLISGGGEPSLIIYDWLQGTIIASATLDDYVDLLRRNNTVKTLNVFTEKRSVSCIRALSVGSPEDEDSFVVIALAFEGWVVAMHSNADNCGRG
jgi:tRNA (guanine-N(7)-)-methyltransferase subunit TRM82